MHIKILVRHLCWLTIFLSLTSEVIAKTYFVAVSGSDKNTGTINAPLKTLAFALSMLSSGDTLFIGEGIYYLEKGTSIKSNCTIQNFNNEQIEIHGTEVKNNWVQLENNLWKCNQKDSAIQLFINGTAHFQASYPKINEGINALKQGAFSIAYPNKQLYIDGLIQLLDIKNAKAIGIHGNKLVALNGNIINQNNNLVTLNNDAWYWDTTTRIRKEYLDTGQAFIFGSKQLIEREFEWYWEKGELFLSSISNPNDINIEVRSNKTILDFTNVTNCTIKNIRFFGASISLRNSNNCIIRDCKFFYPTPFFSFRQGYEKFSPNGINGYENPENWNENGPDWAKYDGPETWNGNGIEISGENNTIENCYIAHSWGDGLTVWGKGHKIINNIITDCNWMGIDCSPLNISGANHLVQFNELSFSGRSILQHRFLEKSKILNNHIHHGGLLCNDQGLTYSFWTDGKGTEIAYNYLHDNLGTKNQCGIYLDNWTYNFSVHHNIVNNTGVGININKPHNNHLIYHNTLYNNTYSMGCWGPDGNEKKKKRTHL